MSQHVFETIKDGREITVLMGWDRPLQGFFLVIDYVDSDGDEPLWSNLTHHDPPHPKSLDSFLAVLKEFEITIPKSMIAELLQDQVKNAGNKQISHF